MIEITDWVRTEPAYEGDRFTYCWYCSECGAAHYTEDMPEGEYTCECGIIWDVRPYIP